MNSRKSELESLLHENPNDVFLNYALGLEWNVSGHYKQAEQQFIKVLELDAQYHAAHFQLGQMYELQHQNSKAAWHYTSGIAVAKHLGHNKAAREYETALNMLS